MLMDLLSLKLIKVEKLGMTDKKEIQRRKMMLILYLMRSPFYDCYSRNVLSVLLGTFSRLPIIGFLPKHIINYIPYWQQLYSYVWD